MFSQYFMKLKKELSYKDAEQKNKLKDSLELKEKGIKRKRNKISKYVCADIWHAWMPAPPRAI